MGQASNPLANRVGYAQFWETNWITAPTKLIYPQLVKLFRLFSELIKFFFFFKVIPRNTFFFLDDFIGWQRLFFKKYGPGLLHVNQPALFQHTLSNNSVSQIRYMSVLKSLVFKPIIPNFMLTKSLKKNHSIFAKRTKKRIFKNGIFHKYPLQRHHLDLIYRKYTFKNYTSKLAHFLKNRIKPLNLCLNIQNVGLLNIFQPSLNRLALAGGTTKISRTIAHNLIQQKKKNIKEQFRRRIVTRIYTLNKLRKKCSMPRSRKWIAILRRSLKAASKKKHKLYFNPYKFFLSIANDAIRRSKIKKKIRKLHKRQKYWSIKKRVMLNINKTLSLVLRKPAVLKVFNLKKKKKNRKTSILFVKKLRINHTLPNRKSIKVISRNSTSILIPGFFKKKNQFDVNQLISAAIPFYAVNRSAFAFAKYQSVDLYSTTSVDTVGRVDPAIPFSHVYLLKYRGWLLILWAFFSYNAMQSNSLKKLLDFSNTNFTKTYVKGISHQYYKKNTKNDVIPLFFARRRLGKHKRRFIRNSIVNTTTFDEVFTDYFF